MRKNSTLYKCRYVTQDGFCIVNNYTKCVIQACDITNNPSLICNDYNDYNDKGELEDYENRQKER